MLLGSPVLCRSGSKLSNLLQTNSIIVAYVYIVRRGEKERLAETFGLELRWLRTLHVMALTVFVFLFYSDDNLELLPHCKSDGSFHVVRSWFIVLLTVSLQLLTVVSFCLFSGVTEYYTETFFLGGGVACVSSHQPSTNTGCLVCIPLSLLSEPLHRER